MGLYRKELAWLISWFTVSRVLFHLVGIRFDPHFTYLGMQTLDLGLLSDHLIQSIYYLHSQPPVLNLLLGATLKLFPVHYELVLAGVFKVFGLSIALMLYTTMIRLRVNAKIALVLVMVYVVSPPAILYESWFSYTHLVIFLLSGAVFSLALWKDRRETKWLVVFFATIATIILTRSLFHVSWMLIIIGLFWLIEYDYRKRIIVASFLPLLIVSLWYGKNYVVFDSFGSSSWLGMSLHKVAVPILSSQELRKCIEHGHLTSISSIRPFSRLGEYDNFPAPLQPQFESIPALTDTSQNQKVELPAFLRFKQKQGYVQSNFNHYAYLHLADLYSRDAINFLFHHPRHYLRNVAISITLSFTAPSSYPPLDTNREKIYWYDKLFNHLVLGAIINPPDFKEKPGTQIKKIGTMSSFVIVLYCLIAYWGFPIVWNPKPKDLMWIFSLLTVGYIFLVSNLIEHLENMRYNYLAVPCIMLLASVLVTKMLDGGIFAEIRKRRRIGPSSNVDPAINS